MTTYVVGDIQGCYRSLMALLDSVSFDEKQDKLIAVGDLINRGDQSLEVLEFFLDHEYCDTVLGNHDFMVPVLYHKQGFSSAETRHSLELIRNSSRFEEIYQWIISRDLFMQVGEYALVHAGILPTWSIEDALSYNQEIKNLFQDKQQVAEFFKNFFSKCKYFCWRDSLSGFMRYKNITDVFTRLRFLRIDGSVCLERKDSAFGNEDYRFVPWFKEKRADNQKFLFGHWSTLHGRTDDPKYTALDTGCVFGGELSMFAIETQKIHRVKYVA